MAPSLPSAALWLGVAGLIPFLAAAGMVLAGIEAWRGVAVHALVGYAATILSFLGAVHWGFALRAPEAEAWATGRRLALGVVPALIAWAALLAPDAIALGVLIAAFLAVWAAEEIAGRQGLRLPRAAARAHPGRRGRDVGGVGEPARVSRFVPGARSTCICRDCSQGSINVSLTKQGSKGECTIMTERAGAEVIPFPGRLRRPLPGETEAAAARERMARALAALEGALAEQRTAVAGLQAALADLGAATARIDRGLNGFASRLDEIAHGVRGVGAKARDLEAWADGVLARVR